MTYQCDETPSRIIGRSLIDASYSGWLAQMIHAGFDRLALTLRQRAEERARVRERVRTAAIMAELPRDIRCDIGWPARYEEEVATRKPQ